MSRQAEPDQDPTRREGMSQDSGRVSACGEGHVDASCGGVLHGWAWYPQQPDSPALIEVLAGDDVIARGVADRFREDLRLAGKRDGHCAFEIVLPESLPGGQVLRVLAGHGAHRFLLHGGELPVTVHESRADTSPDAGEGGAATSVLPVALNGQPGMVGFLDDFGRDGMVRGWLSDEHAPGRMLTLEFIEDGEVVLEVPVCDWREDLAELRQGDGGCGFHAMVPAALCDGRVHVLDVQVAGRPGSLLAAPVRVRVEPRRDTPEARRTLSQAPVWRWPSAQASTLKLSVVVVFYNMRREAERTLTSLSMAYQRGVDGLEYEVLCVDNGSDPALDEAWVRGFGPQFRLIRPSQLLSSPCAAINEAVSQARGEYVAIMIDGAHVLTPGIFREAMDAFAVEPDAVVAVRHWFVGFDQRWLSVSGYTREMEDLLFQRIHWPRDGYRLFRIGAAMSDSADPWFETLYESNCLFLPRKMYVEMGGIDEAFSEPGGGFANLDLARRASDAAPDKLICLLGEATFHQYHHGTTTNVADAAKDAQVRAYAMKYRRLRGYEFEGIQRDRLRYRGIMRDTSAMSVRQRPPAKMALGVTANVRPGSITGHFDEGAQSYLQSVYAELGLHRRTRWMGREVDLAPADLVNLENILGEQRPTRIVVTGDHAGLVGFLDGVLALHGLHDALVIRVVDGECAACASGRVRTVTGPLTDPGTLLTVERLLGMEERTLVLFRPGAGDDTPGDALAAYARFVTFRSYLLFLGSVFGQPWLGYSTNWYRTAIRAFIRQHGDFVVDASRELQMLTSCPSGYLQRVRGGMTLDRYDPSLDEVEAL